MEFIKVTNDIYNEYVKHTGKETLSLTDMNAINTILYEYISSYYFKDLYDGVHLRITNDGYKLPYFLINEKRDNTILNIDGEFLKVNLLTNTDCLSIDPSILKHADIQKAAGNHIFPAKNIFDVKYNTYADQICISALNETEKLIIQNLKESSKFYSMIFESKPIKKILHLQSRKDLKFTKLDCQNLKMNEILKELAKYHKIPSNSLINNLAENYDLRYLKTMKRTKALYIAYNENEIAGILSVDQSYYLKEIGVVDFNKFNYVESLTVSKSFRGMNLGIQLFEQLMKDADMTNTVIILSRYSENGLNYLKDKIEQLCEKNNHILVIHDNEKDLYAYPLVEILFNNETKSIYKDEIDTELPQLQRSFDESLSLLKLKIERVRDFNKIEPAFVTIELEKAFKECVDSDKLRLKIKPQ